MEQTSLRPAESRDYEAIAAIVSANNQKPVRGLELMTQDRLVAEDDFDNPAMLSVNEKLGYQIVPGPRVLKKVL